MVHEMVTVILTSDNSKYVREILHSLVVSKLLWGSPLIATTKQLCQRDVALVHKESVMTRWFTKPA